MHTHTNIHMLIYIYEFGIDQSLTLSIPCTILLLDQGQRAAHRPPD